MRGFSSDSEGKRTGLARALSKLGYCSRSDARELIVAGRVRVNSVVCMNPERPVSLARERIEVDGQQVRRARTCYIMLNKPRGLVTTASDEQGRSTVFDCLAGADLPFLAPVGRLDKASEGLLLLTNDTAWAAQITDPASEIEKTYHVQINCPAGEVLLASLHRGFRSGNDLLTVRAAQILRSGGKNSWLEIVLSEGKNRHIRRIFEAADIAVLRLIRIAIGPLKLGNLPKGAFRHLTRREQEMLRLS